MNITAVVLSVVLVESAAATAAPTSSPPVVEGKTLTQWIATLADSQDKNRLKALKAIAQMGPAAVEAVPSLTRTLLDDENPRARLRAAEALYRIGPAAKSAVPALLNIAADEAEPNRVRGTSLAAANAIAPDNPKVSAAIRAGAHDGELAPYAMNALANLGDNGLPLITELLDNPDARVRVQAVMGLRGRLNGKGMLPLMAKRLRDKDAEVRHQTLESFINFQPSAPSPEVRDALVAELRDADLVNRRLAARFLLPFLGKSEEMVPPVVAAFRDEDEEVRANIIPSLEQLKPHLKSAYPKLVEALTDPTPRVRYTAARMLKDMPLDASGVGQLRKLLQDSDLAVRGEAARTLGTGGPEASAAAPDLIAALSDPNFVVRELAAEALGSFPENKDIPEALKKAERDPQPSVSKAATRSLEKLAGARKKP